MKDSEGFGWALVIAFVVWLLGVLWHPFGYPSPTWHWVLWILIILFGMGFIYSSKEEDKEPDQEEDKE